MDEVVVTAAYGYVEFPPQTLTWDEPFTRVELDWDLSDPG